MKSTRHAVRRLLPLLTALAACSAAPELPDWPVSHPASPAADAAPEPAPSSTLTMPERKPRADRAGTPVRGH
ncbi:MAG: hypothetical protein MUC36_18345 [Planctomycetes bacterium]|nr:hypothetical protein [Planctomycetota bacterium]